MSKQQNEAKQMLAWGREASSTSAVVEQSIYNTPSIIEAKSDKIVTFEMGNYSEGEHRNSFFTHMELMYRTSTTNKACIDSISDFVYGKGLAIMGTDEEGNDIPKEKGPKASKLNNILTAKDLKRITKDYVMFNNVAIQIHYSGKGRRKKVEKLAHFPIQTLCMHKMENATVKSVGYHPKWSEWEKRDKIEWLPTFGNGGKDAEVEIYILQPYVPGMWYWVLPNYVASLDYAVLENRISEFLIDDIDGGFSGTTLINIQRQIQDPNKRDYMAQDIKDKLTGPSGDKTVIFFNRNENEKVSMERFPLSDAADHFDYLSQECSRKLLTGHRITNPKLLAIPTPGEQGLGNNANEIQVAAEMFGNIVISPIQENIIDGIKEILAINNFDDDLMFIDLDIVNFESHRELYMEELNVQHQTMEESAPEDAGKEADGEKQGNGTNIDKK